MINIELISYRDGVIPLVHSLSYKYELFPNNELKIAPIKWPKDLKEVQITFIHTCAIDIVQLQLLKKYLDDSIPLCKKYLKMQYIPYERMDRETEHQVCTCKYFCKLINELNFDKVKVLDPHSNVATALLERVCIEDINYYIDQIIKNENPDAIFMPDVGAFKKYCEVLNNNLPKFWGNKHRDLDSGEITSYQVIGDIDVSGKAVLIVDDICVKGYTTLFAARELKKLGAKRIIFYCSHCEESIWNGELLNSSYVDMIYTTDSMRRSGHGKIEVIE